jgi:hypothetical protein
VNGLIVFGLEVAVSLAVSTFILVRLQALLRSIGNDVCERGNRGVTEFWLAYTQLMMVIAPVLFVAWFSHAGRHYDVVEQVKSSLGLVLFGQFAGLVLVGRAVWKSIVREPAAKPAAPAPAAKPLAAA